MRQMTLSVALEVQPESCARLSRLIDDLRLQEESVPHSIPESYDRIKRTVPTLHLMSMSVFPAADYDPLFVIEANFDGAPGVFWGQLEAAIGDNLRQFVRCCKRPLDQDGLLFDAITAPTSRAPIAPYFEARTLKPSAFHQGNRGLTRDRILTEGDLYLATRDEIAHSNEGRKSHYRGVSPELIHQQLRAALLPKFGWLDQPAAARISAGERIADLLRLTGFAFFVLFVLSLPGILLAALAPTGRYFIVLAIALAAILAALLPLRTVLPDTAAPRKSSSIRPSGIRPKNWLLIAFFVPAYIAVASILSALVLVPATDRPFDIAFIGTLRAVLLGLVSVLTFAIPGVLLWVRVLERRDSSQDAPPINDRLMREMGRREDWITQNHMGSIVLVKPGVLRTVVFRAGHWALGMVLRVTATDGYLGSMRTIHFAHWAFVNNGHRLMFFSNFDHSWESYLDDFIEKAHGGLTLAWGSCVGFPPTRFLIKDGASHGHKFKAWARHSMAVSRFWFSAYSNLSTDQIERNFRIAQGLRKKTLSPEEARLWVNNL